jgi:hypothetical protein
MSDHGEDDPGDGDGDEAEDHDDSENSQSEIENEHQNVWVIAKSHELRGCDFKIADQDFPRLTGALIKKEF